MTHFSQKKYMGGLKLILPLVSLFQIREILILARKILKIVLQRDFERLKMLRKK